MFGQDTATTTLLVEVASLAATLAIPVVLFFVARRGEKATQEILGGQRQLLEAMRIDDLVAQAESLESAADLDLVLEEAGDIKDERRAARIREAYWKNPAVPLNGFGLRIDERAIAVTRRRLEPKLARTNRSEALGQLARFIADAERLDCEGVGSEVSDWVFGRFESGVALSDLEIRDLLRGVDSPGTFSALLDPLDEIHRRLPDAAVVNVLTGVCLAFLDRIGYFSDRSPSQMDKRDYFLSPADVTWTYEKHERELSEAMLSQLASLLHRDRLMGFAEFESTDCSIEPVVAYGPLVAAVGAASFANDWEAFRSLEGIQRLRIDRNALGTFDREWCFGRAKFESHQSGLLRAHPIEALAPDRTDGSEAPPTAT